MRSWVRGNSTVSRGALRIPGPTKVWSGRGIPRPSDMTPCHGSTPRPVIAGHCRCMASRIYYRVADTATVTVQGVALRRIAVSVIYEPFGPDPVAYDTLYERIGSGGYSSFDPPHPAADGSNIFFRWYRDADITHAPLGAEDRGFTLAIDEAGPSSRIMAHPNPDHDRVRFSGPERGTWQVRVYDARGALIDERTVIGTQELDVGVLAPDLYTLVLLGPQSRATW
jgi:hypothetical protein